jgi:NADPH2:quinone reductase
MATGLQALVVEYGEDQVDAIERITLQPQPPPSLDEVKDGDIIVAVKATEVVWTDTIMASGQYQHQASLPYSPGMTYSGIVAWSSPKATQNGIKVGDRVAIAGDAGPRSLGRYQKWGGCASYAVAPYTAVRQFPPSWSFPQAAAIAYGYDTAYHCLVEAGQVQSGESILIHGATGGVGIPAVHMAVMLGLKVFATTRSPEKAEFLRSIGVHHVILLSENSKFSEEIKKLTNGKGIDIVYDGVGGDSITVESMKSLKFGGRLLIVGWASTPNVARGKGQRGAPNVNKIPTNLIMMKSLRIIGCPAMISAKHDPTLVPRRSQKITEWLMTGKLPPPTIARTFPLTEIKEALKTRVDSGSLIGSTVVVPPEIQSEIWKAKL